jgi:hypothetical protein
MAVRYAGAATSGAALSSGLLRGPRSDAVVPVFLEAMRRLGFIEGQNLTFDYRAYAQHIDKLSEWAAELSKARVDVITTVGDLAIRAAQEATKPFLSLRSQTIWSKLPFGRAIEFTSPEHNGSQHPCDRARRQREEILIEAVSGPRRMAALVVSNRTSVLKLDALQEAAAKATSSFQYIESPVAQRSRRQRHGAGIRRRSGAPTGDLSMA